jgi:3-hydroxymyristoyl/3-hydroxydecanoyl-(acyl carrier protein) dehydratase
VQLIRSEGVDPKSRCLDGHFPGNPIVPGAVLLGLAEQALRDIGYEIKCVQRMKFLRQLIPDQPYEITLEIGAGGTLAKLAWISGTETLANARVELRPTNG